MRTAALGLALASLLVAPACATYSDDLARSQTAYEASEDDRALAILRTLEPDLGRLTETERAHYAYLRGMTDVHIGYKSEGRHWLSIAAAAEQKTPGSIPPDWAKRMTAALKELNEEVYASGIESLSNTAAAKTKTSDDDSSSEGQPKDDDSAGSKPKPAKKSSDDE
jgi:hypothetical protein